MKLKCDHLVRGCHQQIDLRKPKCDFLEGPNWRSNVILPDQMNAPTKTMYTCAKSVLLDSNFARRPPPTIHLSHGNNMPATNKPQDEAILVTGEEIGRAMLKSGGYPVGPLYVP